MRHIRMFGLLAATTAAALMVFAASAFAATVTSPTGTVYTSTITAVNEGPITFEGPWADIVCNESHIEGVVEQHGSGVTAKGNIAKLSFGKCNFPTTVLEEPAPKYGYLEVHAVNTSAGGVSTCTSGVDTCQGTLTASGQKLLLHTSVGTCTYRTTNTDIGVLTTTEQTNGHAKLDIAAHHTSIFPRTEGNFLCGTTGQWTGSYTVTTPRTLWIDHS